MSEPRLETLGVLRPLPPSTSNYHPNDDRHGAAAPVKHVVPLGRLVDNLFEAQQSEVQPLVGENRSQSAQGSADNHAGQRILGERPIQYALRTKFLQETGGSSENALRIGNAETNNECAWIF